MANTSLEKSAYSKVPKPQTYTVEALCHNCGYEDVIETPKGIVIRGQLRECPNCGCETFTLKVNEP
jgi:rRNA maturation protein Nop10